MLYYLVVCFWFCGSWGNYNFDLYVELVFGVDQESVVDKMYFFIKDNIKGGLLDYGIMLYVILDFYFYLKYENGKVVGGWIDYVCIFFWVFILVFLIVCINYMNFVMVKVVK